MKDDAMIEKQQNPQQPPAPQKVVAGRFGAARTAFGRFLIGAFFALWFSAIVTVSIFWRGANIGTAAVMAVTTLILALAAAFSYRCYILTFVLFVSAILSFVVGGAIAFALKPNPAMYIGTVVFFVLLVIITKFMWGWMCRKIFGEQPTPQYQSAGDGSASNPYIIEDWDISASTSHGIWIVNTNAYFVIRDCKLHDGKSYSHYGIFFYNVQNGKIENCEIYKNLDGIELGDSSSNNIITNCDVHNNDNSIWLYHSSNNNAITNCNVYNNCYGFLASSSSNNQISNCAVYNHSNDGIYLYNSSNAITNCIFYNNSRAIYLESSSNGQILNCIIYNNYGYGIYLEDSPNNQIHYCNIYGNTVYGVYNYNSEAEYQVDAIYNWWGSADGPGGVGPGSGDAVYNNSIIPNANVTIKILETDDEWSTTTDSTGNYSKTITAPYSPGEYTIRVIVTSDNRTGWKQMKLTVEDMGGEQNNRGKFNIFYIVGVGLVAGTIIVMIALFRKRRKMIR